ncbi:MAG: hypothetical protein CVV37_04110 [Nitrospira bacterium HGW-Nitrospira-1]|nr:MAG: hypothetical protein CVV37_04110 [Nitrospira bacterium HGW-Nitrospira-1]
MYKWQQVKALRTQGESIKKIAKQMKLSDRGTYEGFKTQGNDSDLSKLKE